MHLIINPSDIYYLTGVHSHDPGEILILINEEIVTVTPAQAGVYQGWIPASAGMTGKSGTIFCDPRTSALFKMKKMNNEENEAMTDWQIIDSRDGWRDGFLSIKETIYTDPDFLTQTLREKIEGYGVKLDFAKSPVTLHRVIKTPMEIEKLRKSQQLNKLVLEKILPFLETGVTEEAIARRIQIIQLELGASGPSFPPIVAFGEHSAIPHHSPTDKVLRDSDTVLIDMGLIFQGYCSDMTRTFVFDEERIPKTVHHPQDLLNFCPLLSKGEMVANSPLRGTSEGEGKGEQKRGGRTNEQQKIISLLQDITNFIISWAKPGMRVADIDAKAREMMGEYELYFTHSLGHGVGIDIHEAPHISSRSDEILEVGMVITIEPGAYFVQSEKVESIEQKVQTHKKSPTLTSSLLPEMCLNGISSGTERKLLLHFPKFPFGARYEEMCVVTENGLELL